MTLLLRKIRKSKWYKSKDWLRDDELQADALGDIATADNCLSVWIIADDKSNLEAVVTAIAAGRNAASNLDVAIFSDTSFLDNGIKMHEAPGESVDSQVNKFHRELIELSAGRLLALAKIIQNAKIERFVEPKILTLISSALREQRFGREILSEHIRKKLPD